ncbi:DUF4297 domain-containing protein [Enterococcus casseliflavus]|uniref:dsDNA nuclease domain-containing protein n=1 Tax=Enterococcus casseliflavus TaxID=37734 RepID=UPI002DC03A86|nr:dsDNA nuclease domain-containing protein [Enterococcus casseliflavus]MEB8416585.1 DUF4297 domain-containing protein [Enterococcus casseliflavus]
MNISEVSKKLLSMEDKESGGDNALDGFEFQISSAIYLMFEQLQCGNDFSLLYEKLEDFVIINDKINLYQSKGISVNITPLELIKNRSKSKDKTNESILEKMYDNYLQVKNEIEDISVETNLIICNTTFFSRKLWDSNSKYNKELEKLSFDNISESSRNEMLMGTRHDSYDWSNIKARRLIPKPSHEEVTRCFLEDVIQEKFGDTKINSSALYGALVTEIKKIRKSKLNLTSGFLQEKLTRFVSLESDLEYRDVAHFLSTEDSSKISIKRTFEEFKISTMIHNHPTKNDYRDLQDIFSNNNFDTLYDFFDYVKEVDSCKELCLRLSDVEIKALILLVIGS